MRSILLDRSLHFFRILEYDKGEWFDFWRDRYRKSFPRVVPLYEKKHGLSDEKIREILESFNRSFLDRLRFKVESELKEHKKKALEKINDEAEHLKLSAEDFHMMIITLLGLEESTFVETERKGLVVLVDPLAMELKGKFDRFASIVLESAMRAREILDRERLRDTES